MREGSLDAPTRHPLDWKSDDFWDKTSLNDELERVFDVCHGCRRCVSLCDAFPTLFDLIDESDTMEVDGVDKADYGKVAEQCYLCDLCYLTKCPYVPPHEFNVDFPHLMLRAKAQKYKDQGASLRDRTLTSTDKLLGTTSIPLVDITVNALNNTGVFRKALSAVWMFIMRRHYPSCIAKHFAKGSSRCCKLKSQNPLATPRGRSRSMQRATGTTTAPRLVKISSKSSSTMAYTSISFPKKSAAVCPSLNSATWTASMP